ncbi:MAG: rRNA methyltransferase [Cyclobacteriaceae bacterium]|nr:rRNA methyltransferase [Cyclobacteriaceae bacterium]MDH4294997.1 rRNA methyltransferase [Cyclobacteriaceae bacterium]
MIDTFPIAFESRMRHSLGTAWDLFASAHEHSSPVAIRINPEKYKTEGPGQRVPWSAHGRYLSERPVFTLDPLLHGGAYYVQEASSMFLEQVFRQIVGPAQPLTLLDLCAAPGGKSTHLLSLVNRESLLVANEVIRSRATILLENIEKWGSNNVVVTNNDPQDFQRLGGFFDIVVVDAPCSGEGLFRKDPQSMKEWSADHVMLCSKRQRRVVSDVWPTLKEDGILIYSTCTYSTLENEENLKWLKSASNVEFLSLRLEDDWGIETIAQDGIIGYRFYPHRVNGEGFFMAVIRKKEKHHQPSIGNLKKTFNTASKKIMEQLDHWIKDDEDFTFIQREHLLQFFSSRHRQAIEYLTRNLRLLSAGTFAATIKHEKLIPEHALALSLHVRQENFAEISLTRTEALQYLRKETLTIALPQRGFALVQYEKLPIGWVNVLQNRLNNLYPAAWRIRMVDR